jgi:(2Fe-2S) ferredoxin
MKIDKLKVGSDIEVHYFVCTNERMDKNKSCGKNGSIPLFKYLKQRMKSVSEKYAKRVKVNSSGCLSNCSNGPVVVCYPEGDWFNIRNARDVDMLVHDLEARWMEEFRQAQAAQA